MDQGRHGIPPRTHPGGPFAEHRDPHARDGPAYTAVLRSLLVPHPRQQRRDSPRGTERRCPPRGTTRTLRDTWVAASNLFTRGTTPALTTLSRVIRGSLDASLMDKGGGRRLGGCDA